MKINAMDFQRNLNEKFILGINTQKSLLEGHHTELYLYPYLLWLPLSDITVAPDVIILDYPEVYLEFYPLS